MKKLISSVLCISWYVMICAAFSSYAGVVEATSPVFALSLKNEEGAEVDSCKFYLVSKICIDSSTKVWYLEVRFLRR